MDQRKTGGLIAAVRKELGLTQRQLAERLRISDRTVSKWERGAGFPDVSLLEPLADALGLSVVELVRGEQDPALASGKCTAAPYSRWWSARCAGGSGGWRARRFPPPHLCCAC